MHPEAADAEKATWEPLTMADTLSQKMQALDEYRQRAREALAPVRCELAAWFRDFFRRKKGPAKVTHMNLVLVRGSETPQPQWEFDWYPGMHNRYNIFKPSQPVPEISTEADAGAVGLHPTDLFALRYCAFQDLAADAWEEAGGFSFPKRLMIAFHEHGCPDAPRRWVEITREEIRRLAESGGKKRPQWGLGPPQPLGLPEVPAAMIEAVRNGGATALTEWANALDRAGASEAAGLLRCVSRIHAALADEVRAVSPQFGFAITVNRSGTAWWWIGDMCSESDNEEARQLGRLLSAWNETHPAVEWLLRQFGFPHAAVEAIHHATDESVPTRQYDLTAGQHLDAVEEGTRVLKLDVPGWVPIEGLPPGD